MAVGAFVVVAGAGAVFYGQAQAQAHQRQVEQQQKIEAEQASKRQDCYKKITDANTAQMGHLTYAELYGDQCR